MSFISKIMNHFHHSSSKRLLNHLKKKGVSIGTGCVFRSPKTAFIDLTRPYLIEIGNNVDMNINFKIYTHDWASLVFIAKYGQMLNSGGKVVIGNNVYFGADVTVLKGVLIGDNCVIGAGSVVTHSIPANTVAVGNPCKVIDSIENYYHKRLQKALEEAVGVISAFFDRYGHWPQKSELIEEWIYFDKKSKQTLPVCFDSYEDFIKWCDKMRNK